MFDEQDLDLTAGHIVVQGTLRVGTSAEPFQHRATITLTGAAADGNVMGMGNRVLGVAGGTLDLHGESRLGWTRLAATATGRRHPAPARAGAPTGAPVTGWSWPRPTSIPTTRRSSRSPR